MGIWNKEIHQEIEAAIASNWKLETYDFSVSKDGKAVRGTLCFSGYPVVAVGKDVRAAVKKLCKLVKDGKLYEHELASYEDQWDEMDDPLLFGEDLSVQRLYDEERTELLAFTIERILWNHEHNVRE